MVLIVAHKDDLHAERIEQELHRRGADHFHLDTGVFPSENADIVLAIEDGSFSGKLRFNNKSVNVADIASAYFKEVITYDSANTRLTANRAEFIQCESGEALFALWRCLSLQGCLWLNDPAAMWPASSKLFQQALAAQLGFKVPDTLVTTEVQIARAFIAAHQNGTVTKLLDAGTVVVDDQGEAYGVPTSLIDLATFENHKDVLRQVPYCFQEYVPKGIDLRVTVVGDNVFPVEIHSEQVDWRIDDVENIAHVRHVLPTRLEDLSRQLLRKLGLAYGAIDMVLTPSGDYYFLEVNSVPAWAWIEDRTGFQICAAICDMLLSRRRPSDSSG